MVPYSVRPREHAPISMLLEWSGAKPTLVPSNFDLGNIYKRLQGSDPWKNFFHTHQSLKNATAALRKL